MDSVDVLHIDTLVRFKCQISECVKFIPKYSQNIICPRCECSQYILYISVTLYYVMAYAVIQLLQWLIIFK